VAVAYCRGSVLLQQGDERGNFVGFLPQSQCIYSIAFETHTRTAEPVEMLFRMISGFGPRNSVLRVGDDPRREEAIFWENIYLGSLMPLVIANCTGTCSGARHGQTLYLPALDQSISGPRSKRCDCTARAKSDVYDCLVIIIIIIIIQINMAG